MAMNVVGEALRSRNAIHPRWSSAPLHLALLAALVGGCAGCARSGTGRGTVVEPGRRPEPVAFDWQASSRSGTHGRIEATMPNGDRYAGRFQETREKTDISAFDPLRPSGKPEYDHIYKAVATLTNGRGGSMRCEFILRRPEVGVRGGGNGRCKTSEGRVIENAVLK